MSAHAKLISFREEVDHNPHNFFFSLDDIRARRAASRAIQSVGAPIASGERCAAIEKYGVKYVVAQREYADAFREAMEECRSSVKVAYMTRDLVLLEIE